jgi:hypothetical protein
VTEHRLGLAVNGREYQLRGRLVSFPLPEHAGGTGHVDCNGQGAGYKAGVSDLRECHVLDATYQFDDASERVVV